MHPMRKLAALGAVLVALALAWAHQALTKDAPKTIVVLSTSDVLGYLTPCG